MKVFAFFIATLFAFQTTTPALCMTSCLWESEVVCAMNEADCSNQSSCLKEEKAGSCCADDQITSCTSERSNGINTEHHHEPACNTCRVPCCSAPLCCFYFQEVTEPDFSTNAVLIERQLPSSNGMPNQGFRADCFQPPDVI